MILKRTDKASSVLPPLKCVRGSHKLFTVYCEGRVTEELWEIKIVVLISDGTAIKSIGQIAASNLKSGDRMGALKSAKIVKGDRNN